MTTEITAFSESETKALITVCILAAFADGAMSELERKEMRRIASDYSKDGFDLAEISRKALTGELSLENAVRDLRSREAKSLAQEMAVCVCAVDQGLNAGEEAFLGRLRDALGLEARSATELQGNAAAIRDLPPVIANSEDAELDEMIRDRAILAGALELMPERLATMAIIPIQMRMVYQIGKRHGYQLDLAHAREFIATAGVGLTSQVVESFLSKLAGRVVRGFAGRIAGAIAAQATESGIAFATTYALGQAAKSYYGGGRTLSTAQLREVFSRMLDNGRAAQGQYSSAIAARARSLKISDFLPLVKR